MSTPVPAPRTLHNNEHKKPVPTPRRLIPIITEQSSENKDVILKDWEANFNTFSRRVRTFSNTSKQITEEIAGKVQEKKKAVIEGTRQSVRKITRRFTTAGSDHIVAPQVIEDDCRSESAITDIFNSISFQSPIRSTVSDNSAIYTNVEISTEHSSSEDPISLPPPLHPPPPLREDSIYDQPQSLASGSTNSNSSDNTPILHQNPYDYESVFPAYPYNSDTDSCVDLSAGTLESNVSLTRSESFNYYDPVAKTENIYNNVDSTPVLNAVVAEETKSEIIEDNLDAVSHIDIRNALYENHTIKPPPRTKKLNRQTESVILQFDPLNNINTPNYSNIQDLRALEELLQGDLYGTVGSTFDNWSTSTESELEEYLNPPTPPTRFDSLPDETPVVNEKTKTSWFVGETSTNNKTNNNNVESKAMNWFKQVNEVLKKAPDIVRGHKQKDNVLMRPVLSMKTVVQQKGMLYKVTNGPVEDLFGEFSSRWCILENGCLTCLSDVSGDNVKENFPMDSVLSVQALVDQKYKYKLSLSLIGEMAVNLNLPLILANELQPQIEMQLFELERRVLRDRNNPFEIPKVLFKKLYRLPKPFARNIIDEMSVFLIVAVRNTSVPNHIKILCALHFFAHGSYQKSVGRDFLLVISQTTVSRSVAGVSEILSKHFSQAYIRFPRNEEERRGIKKEFMWKYNFPGVIGCIDCTHVAIVASPLDHQDWEHPDFALKDFTV